MTVGYLRARPELVVVLATLAFAMYAGQWLAVIGFLPSVLVPDASADVLVVTGSCAMLGVVLAVQIKQELRR